MHFTPFTTFLVVSLLYGSVVAYLEANQIEVGGFYRTKPSFFKKGGVGKAMRLVCYLLESTQWKQ